MSKCGNPIPILCQNVEILVTMLECGNWKTISVPERGSRSQSNITITQQDHILNSCFHSTDIHISLSTSMINIATCVHIQVSQQRKASIYQIILESQPSHTSKQA